MPNNCEGTEETKKAVVKGLEGVVSGRGHGFALCFEWLWCRFTVKSSVHSSTDAVVDFHGTKTDIHSNKRHGIRANYRAKLSIHLPSN